jgi:hypothetical protein
MASQEAIVRTYSGHTYADHPLSFEWQGQHYIIARTESTRRVLDSTSGVVVTEFVVTTGAGQRFRLCYEETHDRWAVEPEGES